MISIGIGQQQVLYEANNVFTDFREMGIAYIKELIHK